MYNNKHMYIIYQFDLIISKIKLNQIVKILKSNQIQIKSIFFLI